MPEHMCQNHDVLRPCAGALRRFNAMLARLTQGSGTRPEHKVAHLKSAG